MMSLKNLTFISVCLLTLASRADRSVNIATSTGEIELVNGSNVNVAYSIECYDKDSAAVLTNSTATNQTLNTKKSIKYGGSYGCVNGSTLHYTYPQGAYLCKSPTPATTSYSTATGYCGAGASLCTFSKLDTLAITDLGGAYYGYWFDGGSGTWYSTYDSWTGNTPQTGTSDAPKTSGPSMPNNRCSQTTSGGVGNCSYMLKSSASGEGALCCPSDNPFRSCKVTVHGTTGFLQSPQFKGGTPF